MKKSERSVEIEITVEEAKALQTILEYVVAKRRETVGKPEKNNLWRKIIRIEKNIRETLTWEEKRWKRWQREN